MSGSSRLLMGLAPMFGTPAIGLAMGASVLEGAASYREGKNTAKAYDIYAENAQQEAKSQAAQEREKYRKLASSHRAAMGSSGIDVNVGSTLDVLADTEAEGEVSARRILHGGELESYNWQRRAASARQSGKKALAGSIVSGATTGLLASKYTRPFGSGNRNDLGGWSNWNLPGKG